MTIRVNAFGKTIAFPAGTSPEDIESHIASNRALIDPDYKEPEKGFLDKAGDFGKDFIQNSLGVDMGVDSTPTGVTGLLNSVSRGARQTGRMVGSTVDTVRGNLPGVEQYGEESKQAFDREAPVEQKQLLQELHDIDRDQSVTGQIGDTLSAAGRNKMGTAQLVAEQLPNTAVSLGGGYAGAKTGAAIGSLAGPVGAGAGGILGFLGGMFLGNVLLETGGKAIEKAEGGFTPEERDETLREGPIKAGVITGVDAATLGVGGKVTKALSGMAKRAGARAEAKVLMDAGVNMATPATINSALSASPALMRAAKVAGEKAALSSLSASRKAGIAGTGLALETVGEGVGEYLGELAATGDPDVVDATIESLAGMSQSMIETAYNYNKIGTQATEQDVAKAASDINAERTQQGIDNIATSGSVDEAIQAASDTVSQKPVTTSDVWDDVNARNELLQRAEQINQPTGVQNEAQTAPAETTAAKTSILNQQITPQSTETALNQAVLGDNVASNESQARQQNIGSDSDIIAQNLGSAETDERNSIPGGLELFENSALADSESFSNSRLGQSVISEPGNNINARSDSSGINSALIQPGSDSYIAQSSSLSNISNSSTSFPHINNVGGINGDGNGLPSFKSINRQDFSNKPRSDVEFVSNLSRAKSFQEKGLDSLDRNAQRVVMDVMLSATHNNKILDSIVGFFPVDVVNDLARQKLTPKMLFHNPPMLLDSNLGGVGDSIVPLNIKAASASINAIARVAAKYPSAFVSSDSIDRPFNGSSASGTINNRHDITPNSDVVTGALDVDASSTPPIISNKESYKKTSNQPTQSLKKVASWVIKDKSTGDVLFETYDKNKVAALNVKKYEAVPIQKHLSDLNEKNNNNHESAKYSRSSEERLKDRERSRKLERALKNQGFKFRITPKDVRDFAAMDRGRQDEAVTAERLAGIFKKRITWIEADGDFDINGVMLPSIKDTIFVDVNTDKSAHVVIGHELSHHMEQDVPEVYQAMVDALMEIIPSTTEYAKKYGIKGADDAYIIKEIVGDIVGDNFTDQKFWNKVAAYNPNAFQRIADTVISWLKKLVANSKLRKLGSEQWVTDAQNAQDIVAKTVAKYTNQESTDKTSGIKFSFAGQKSQTANKYQLSTAQERLNNGENAEKVRQDTGWFKSVDGKWRYEIDDSEAKLRHAIKTLDGGGYDGGVIKKVVYRRNDDDTFSFNLIPENPQKTSDIISIESVRPSVAYEILPQHVINSIRDGDGSDSYIGPNLDEAKELNVDFTFDGINALPLEYVLDHEKLFAAYPALRDISVQVNPKIGAGGSFGVDKEDGMNPVITVGKSRQLSTLLHEIQHGIQNIEGFASGGTVDNTGMIGPENKLLSEQTKRKIDIIYSSHREDAQKLIKEHDQDKFVSDAYSSWVNKFGKKSDANPTGITKEDAVFFELSENDPVLESLIKTYNKQLNLGALSPAQVYRRLAGEIESRNVQFRQNWNDDQRRETSPEASADIPAEEAIVVYNGKVMDSAPQPENALQSKRAQEYNTAKFSKAIKDIEDKNLVVTHNLTADNLRHANEIGGLAAPSLAVIRKENEFSSFGEITLIAKPDILESNKVRSFDADVYSPRHPRLVNDINNKRYYAFMDSLGNVNGLDTPSIDELSDKTGIEAFTRSPGIQYAWLRDNGIAPPLKPKKIDKDVFKILKAMKSAGITHSFEADKNSKISAMVDSYVSGRVKDFFERTGRKSDEEFVADMTSAYKRDLFNAIHSYNQSGGRDLSQLKHDVIKKMRNKSTDNKFNLYALSKFNSLVDGKKIFKGTTNSGNRRYVPYNMENIIKEMTRELRSGEGFNYGPGNIRAAFAKEFKSVRDIQKDRDKIVSSNDMEEFKKESNDRTLKAAEDLKPYYKYDSTSYRYYDDALSAIAEGPKGWNEAFNMNADARKIITDLTSYLINLPTEYFEAKAQRPVSINEFSAAVVPNGTPKDVIDILKSSGLSVKKYKPNDIESRINSLSSAAEKAKVLFSRKESVPDTITVSGKERSTRNSDGNLIHPTEEGIKNFWEWFGDSKIVDDQGRPRVVYHGSPNDFNVFHFENMGEQGTSEGQGLYFTSNKDIATGYSKGGKLFEVYLRLNKPYSDKDRTINKSQLQKILNDLYKKDSDALSNYGDVDYEGLSNVLREATAIENYAESDADMIGSLINGGIAPIEDVFDSVTKITGKDGIITEWLAPDKGSNVEVIVITNPNQIKSATDNTGKFSAKNDDIRFSRSDTAGNTMNNDSIIMTDGTSNYIETANKKIADPYIPKKLSQKEFEHLLQDLDNPYLIDDHFSMDEIKTIIDKLKTNGINHVDMYHVTDAEISDFEKTSKINGSKVSLSARDGFMVRDNAVYGFLDPDDIKNGYRGVLGSSRDKPNVLHIKVPVDDLTKLLWDSNYNVTFGVYSGVSFNGDIPVDWVSGFYQSVDINTNEAEKAFIESRRQDDTKFSRTESKLNRAESVSRKSGYPETAKEPLYEFNSAERLKLHKEYKKAKSGNIESAVKLARDLVSERNLAEAKKRFGSDVVYLPVVLKESDGTNRIPHAIAAVYANNSNAEIETGVFEKQKAFHTGMNMMERLISRASFSGEIVKGKRYVIVDDVTTSGATLSDLASYIQENGGEVAGSVLLTNAIRGGSIFPLPKTINRLEARHGDSIREIFGIEPSALTKAESQYLLGFRTDDEIRKRADKAGNSRRERILAKSIPKSEDSLKFSRSDTLSQAGVNTEVADNPSDLPEETKFQAFRRRSQDAMLRFKVMQNWLDKQGVKLSDAANVYQRENISKGKQANKIEDFRRDQLEPLINRIAETSKNADKEGKFTLGDVATYLEAVHIPEANERMRTIHNDENATANGITDEQARKVLKQFETMPNFREFKKLAEELRRIGTETLDMRLEAGLISQDQYDAYKATYDNWVPLRGNMSEQGFGKGLSTNAKDKRRMGHGFREDEFVLENLVQDRERAIMQIEKNKVGLSVAQFLMEAKNENIGTIDKPEKMLVMKDFSYAVKFNGDVVGSFETQSAAKAMVQRIIDKKEKILDGKSFTNTDFSVEKTYDPHITMMARPQLSDNEIQVYVNGHAVKLQLNDPGLARAATNAGIEQVGSIAHAARMFNRFLSKAYTAWSPDFLFMNMARDAYSGTLVLTGKKGVKFAAKTFTNYGAAIRELIKGRNDPKRSEWVSRYRAAGGNIGAAYMSDIERVGEDAMAALQEFAGARETYRMVYNEQISKGAKPAKARTMAVLKAGVAKTKTAPVVGKMFQTLERVNMIIENSLRLATFKTAIESGESDQQAAVLSKDLMNFNRKGEVANQMGALYLFYNPGMQGAHIVGEALFTSPHRKQVWSLLGALTTLSFVLAELARGGDDDEREWENTPDYIKDRNLIFNFGDKQVTVPVAYGFGIFHAMGNYLSDLNHGADKSEIAVKLASGAFENFSVFGNPILENDEGNEIRLDQLLPTFPKIIMAPGINLDGLGRQIHPTKYQDSVPDSQLMWRSVRGTAYEDIAQFMNGITGGSEYNPGAIDVSPNTIKYWVTSLTGGAGRFVSDITTGSLNAAEGVDPEIDNIPVLRKFIREPGVNDTRGAFHKARKEAQSAAERAGKALRNGDIPEYTKMMSELQPIIEIAKYARDAQKMASMARDEVMRIQLDTDMSKAEKKLRIKEIELQEQRVYDQFLSAFDVAKRSLK